VRLEFLSGGAAHGLVKRVAGAAGIEVGGSFGPVGAMRDKLLAGEKCDVIILTHAQVCELTALGKAGAGSIADLGTVRTSIAVRSGDAKPDVSTPEGLRTALLAADEIHFPDPQKATAGIHFAKVVDALGIRAQVESRFRTHAGGLPAMAAVAASKGKPIGCTQATEIVSSAGVELVAPLPEPHGLATVYTAAVNAAAADAKGAHAFVERLTGRASAAVRAAAGIEGAAIRRATRADEAAIRELVFGILAEYAIEPDPEGTDLDLFDLDSHYFAHGGMFDAAIDERGALVACCGSFATSAQAIELRKMYVRRDQRGQGLGQRLLDRALAYARARGAERIELETASVLKEAMAMYEKAGFVRQEAAPHVSRCDRVYSMKVR
jgi:molybdate transport system substrate-binding protein